MQKISPKMSRRNFVLAGAALPLAACGNGLNSQGGEQIDARVDNAIQFMYAEVPGTRELADQAAGMLVMPLITEAGFGFGGAYGRGALRIANIPQTVDYYSAISGSFGFQIGAQQYAHTLFFMTEEALRNFRFSDGWAAGAGVRYAVSNEAGDLSIDTTQVFDPVVAVVYGQAGLIAGATLEGTRYSRIIP